MPGACSPRATLKDSLPVARNAQRSCPEAGVALALTIISLAVIGALVTGAFWVALEEQRIGQSQYRLEQALGAAEAGAVEILRGWDRDSLNFMRRLPHDTYEVATGALPGAAGLFEGRVSRLTGSLYFIEVVGSTDPGYPALARGVSGWLTPGASPGFQPGVPGVPRVRQRIGILARLASPLMETRAAFTTRGDVTLLAGAVVDGTDRIPHPSWTSCGPPDSTRAGLLTTRGAVVSAEAGAVAQGSPGVMRDPVLTNGVWVTLGDVTYEFLVDLATVRLGGGQRLWTVPVSTGAGDCDKTVPTNWGDGHGQDVPCGEYVPIVHAAGDVALAGGRGQGILLVDSDLLIDGPYEYFGIVLAKGAVLTSPAAAGAGVYGAVVAGNSTRRTPALRGATFGFSKCAIDRALRSAGRPVPIGSRVLTTLDFSP